MRTRRTARVRHDPGAVPPRIGEMDAEPDCLAPRAAAEGAASRSRRSSTPLRRVAPASQPRAAAPRRIAASFGGTSGGPCDAELASRSPRGRRRTRRHRRHRCRGRPPTRHARSAGPGCEVIQLTSSRRRRPSPRGSRPSRPRSAVMPWSRYIRSYAASSSVGIVGLVDERARLDDEHRPTRPGRLRRDHAAAGARTDDDDVGLEGQRAVAGPASDQGLDRRRLGGQRLDRRAVADRRPERVGPGLARIGVGEEAQQLLERLVGGPAEREPGGRPAEEVARAVVRLRGRGTRSAGPRSARLTSRDSTRRSTRRSWRAWAGIERRRSPGRPGATGGRRRRGRTSRRSRRGSPARRPTSRRRLAGGLAYADAPGGSRRLDGVVTPGRPCRTASLEALGGPRLAADRAVLAIAEGVVGLDERVQLARALVDHGRLRVAQVALDRELVAVAVRAVDLDRVERRLDRVLGRVPLGEARLAGVAGARGS